MEEEKSEKNNIKKEELKIGFFKKLKISVIDFEQYHIIAADGWKKALIYFLKLILIFSIIVTSLLSFKLIMTLNAICIYAKNDLPNFRIEDGQFYLDSNQPVVIENKDIVKTKIILDNDDNQDKYTKNTNNNQENLIIITKNNIYLKLESTGITSTYQIKELCSYFNIDSFNKNELINALENNSVKYVLIIYLFIVIFIMYFISTIIDILALAVVGFLISRIIGMPLKFSAVFGIATSSMTLPIILNLCYILINMFTGFTMNYFQIMYTIVSYIYMIASLLLMRSNLIKIKTKKSKVLKDKKAESAGEE
ncbi:MAG: DUF1189 domain-containing protein [Clostridia bacterium]|nr:DUF1189 domain-containing protein [Clostridia bacterium]